MFLEITLSNILKKETREIPVQITDSSLPSVQDGEDDKERDCLILGQGGRPSTTGTQYWSMRQIPVPYLNKLRLKTERKVKIGMRKEEKSGPSGVVSHNLSRHSGRV